MWTCYGHLQLQWDYDCPGYATPRRQHFTGLLPILTRYVLATLPPQCSLSLRADSTNVLFRAEYLTRKTHHNCGRVHSLSRGSWTVYHGSEHCPKVFALGFLIVHKMRQAASDPSCLTSPFHGALSFDARAEINPSSLEYFIIATEKETLRQRVNHRVI